MRARTEPGPSSSRALSSCCASGRALPTSSTLCVAPMLAGEQTYVPLLLFGLAFQLRAQGRCVTAGINRLSLSGPGLCTVSAHCECKAASADSKC